MFASKEVPNDIVPNYMGRLLPLPGHSTLALKIFKKNSIAYLGPIVDDVVTKWARLSASCTSIFNDYQIS